MDQQTQYEERFLIAEIKKGNTKAFEVMYRKYHVRLYHFVLKSLKCREDAAGMVQNIFLKIWEKRELLNEELSFSGFVFRMAKNMIYNEIRKQIRDKVLIENEKIDLDSVSSPSDNNLEFEELENCLKTSLAQLPARRREIFELSRYRGLTYREIGEALGISENTVDTQMRKALQFLRNNLDEKYYIILLTSLLLF